VKIAYFYFISIYLRNISLVLRWIKLRGRGQCRRRGRILSPTVLTVLKISCNSRVILLVTPFVYMFLQPETSTFLYTSLVVILLSVLPAHAHLMS
jgi:hypothetical protein